MTRLARTLTKITGVLALSIVGSLVGSSCSTSPHPATVVEIATQLTSQQRTLHKVGANDENVYGWNQLTGTAKVDGATVEMLANVNYLKGSGEFFAKMPSVGWWIPPPTSTCECPASNARFRMIPPRFRAAH